MRKLNVVACLAILALGTTMLYGQATRTWVSGVGDDANPCSRTAPCKTFAGAISKTAPGGEIDALDPGGFGALTITKAITLDGGGGQVASILVSGTNGIVVAAQPNDVVVIRNLRFDGLQGGNSTPGLAGIRWISGKDLNVENCWILGFSNTGIDIELGASGTAHIVNTIIKNIGTCAPASCLTAQGEGIFAKTSAGLVKVGIWNTAVMVTANNGIEASDNSRVSVDHGFISAAGGSGVASTGAGASAGAFVDYSDVIDGNNGLTTANGSSISVSHTTISNNTGTAYNNASGTVFAYGTGPTPSSSGTNRVHDNGATGGATYLSEN